MFGENVYHVPGLCLPSIGGAPYINLKIMAGKTIFSYFLLFRNKQQVAPHIIPDNSLCLGHHVVY